MAQLEPDFDHEIEKIWEETKPPLDRMYDAWVGEGWDDPECLHTFEVFSKLDVKWRGIEVLAGHPFPCHLCGETELWTPIFAYRNKHYYITAFIHEHEPINIGRGSIRQVSSISVGLVGKFTEVQHDDN